MDTARSLPYRSPMNLEEFIIAVVRIGGALLVLRWAFAGSIAAILIDFSDLFMMKLLDLGGVRNYQALDKWLDLAYMLTFLWVAMRWSGAPRIIAAGLFAYRIVGVITFELVADRFVLLFFPNVFEFWFVFVAGMRHYKAEHELTWKRSLLWLIPLTALKEFQEYALHGGKWLDNYRATDVVVAWWDWIVGHKWLGR